MSKKRDAKYFEAFSDAAGYALDAAHYLCDTLQNFDPSEIEDKLVEIHKIEHDGDIARHTMIKLLSREFIAPIEREDIMELSSELDNVIDKTEDVVIRLHIFNIEKIRPEAIEFADVIVKCITAVKDAIDEFQNFKKSKILLEKIIQINHYEDEADALYHRAVRNLFVNEKNPISVAAWNQTYAYMENVCDACENVADIIENIVMKNT
jgi:predicted phosphate transport protein (TIGR00153 family)